MKQKGIFITILACIIYTLQIIFGFIIFFDFSEYVIINTFIYFGILLMSFYTLTWKGCFIADFIKEKKLNILFAVLALIYFIAVIVIIFKSNGIDKMMLYTIFISVFNATICSFMFLS